MADGTQDLLAAFNSLVGSVRSIQIGKAIQSAQADAAAIRADQSKTEFEQIRAQQGLADNIAGSILSLGGDAAHAQQARLSLAPNVPDQAMRALEGTGKSTLSEAQAELQKRALDIEAKKEDREFARQKHLLDMRLKSEEAVASGKAGAAKLARARDIPKQLADKFGEVMDVRNRLQYLLDNFEANKGAIGPLDQFRPNMTLSSDAVTYRKDVADYFNQYRKAITGAAASITELRGLEKALPTVSDWEGDFSAALQRQITKTDEALQTRLKVLRGIGKDTSALEEQFGMAPAETPSPPAGQGMAPGRPDPNEYLK